jgi:N-methylhydantoinase B
MSTSVPTGRAAARPPIREMTNAQFEEHYGCDRVTAEIIRNAMVMAVRHMTNAMQRSSFSPIVRDQRDMACGVFAGEAENYDVVALAEGCMLHICTAPYNVREVVKEYGPEHLRPGDVITSNDPYRGGNHILDVTVIRPVFIDGVPEFYAANRAHHNDMGGSNPGGWNGGSVTHIYQEGLRLGPTLLYAEDEPVRSTFNLFLDNTRLPHNSLGDLRAQYGACVVGERLLVDLVAKHGLDVVKGAVQYVLDHGEQSMTTAIAEIPDGDYEFTDYLDDDGFDTHLPIRYQCNVAIRGGRAEIDFSGTERQCQGNISGVWSINASGAMIAFKMVVDPFTPMNAGAFRPVDLLFPAGSMVNCLPPTSHAASNVVSSERAASAVYGALSRAAPERGFAENLSSTGIICWGGEDTRSGEREPFVNMQLSFGSWGASATADGLPYCLSVVGNCSEIPVEILELEYPFVCLDKEFMIDTAGPGRFRGGPGITYTNRALVPAEISLSCDRMRTGPWGVFGGADAMPQALYEVLDEDAPLTLGWSPVGSLRPISGLFDADGRADSAGEDYKTSKFSHVHVPAQTTLRIINAAGGGYGDPLEREPARVLADVRNELVSREAAREHYGVVLRDDEWAVDEDATARLRSELGAGERQIKIEGWRDDAWFGEQGGSNR